MGTHPIFESDFDCLTEKMLRSGLIATSRRNYKLYKSPKHPVHAYKATKEDKEVYKLFYPEPKTGVKNRHYKYRYENPHDFEAVREKYLEETWDPHVTPSRAKHTGKAQPDQVLAPEYPHTVNGARERFRNRKVDTTANLKGNWTERYHVRQPPPTVMTGKMSTSYKHAEGHSTQRNYTGTGGVRNPKKEMSQKVKEANFRYFQRFKNRHQGEYPIPAGVEYRYENPWKPNYKGPTNGQWDYFPDKHQIGHDHKMGFRPRTFIWEDELSDYWRGNDDQTKAKRVKDLRTLWYMKNHNEDELRGNRRGRSRALHNRHHNMLDTRWFDPNILRIGSDWTPYDKSYQAAKDIKNFREQHEQFRPGYDTKDRSKGDNAPKWSHEGVTYTYPPLHDRCNIVWGLPTYERMLLMLRFQKYESAEMDLSQVQLDPDLVDKVESGFRRGIFQGTCVQVDSGNYGTRTKDVNHLDMGFGSIDKTDKYKGHREVSSLYEDRWKWDERLGVRKLERTSRHAASNMIEQLHYYSKGMVDVYRAKDEHIKAITNIPVLNDEGQVEYADNKEMIDFRWYTDDVSVETWYSLTPPRSLRGMPVETQPELFPVRKLMKQIKVDDEDKERRSLFEPFVNDTINLSRSYEARKGVLSTEPNVEPSSDWLRPHTVFIVDHATPTFDQAPNSAHRLMCDREQQRAFLPLFREDLTDDESFGHMVSTAAGVMKQSMIANSSELEGRAIPCVNIVCITDAGKKMHFGQATCGYDQFERLLKVEQMGGRRKTSNKVLETPELGFVRLGTYHLHDNADVFVWHNEERIDGWRQDQFHEMIRMWTAMNRTAK